MIAAITSGLSSMIGWVGSVLTAIVGSTGAMADLLPVFAIGIAASVVLFGVHVIRKVCWGA